MNSLNLLLLKKSKSTGLLSFKVRLRLNVKHRLFGAELVAQLKVEPGLVVVVAMKPPLIH